MFENSRLYSVPRTKGPVVHVASFDWNPVGLASDGASDDIFAADPFANVIYHVVHGTPRLWAGECESLVDGSIESEDPQLCQGGDVDGDSATARFNQPNGLAFDDADDILFIADTWNNEIRGIRRDGTVFTLAGSCERLGAYPDCLGQLTDGSGAGARFHYPTGIVFDSRHKALYVADEFNHAIRRVSLDGVVTTLAGSGTCELKDGLGSAASFCYPTALAYDSKSDSVVVLDLGNNALRRFSLDGTVVTIVKDLF